MKKSLNHYSLLRNITSHFDTLFQFKYNQVLLVFLNQIMVKIVELI